MHPAIPSDLFFRLYFNNSSGYHCRAPVVPDKIYDNTQGIG